MKYIAAYDTERPEGLPAVRRLVEIHKALQVPATFFVVGRVAEQYGPQLRKLWEGELFDIQSHTYDHTHVESHPPDEVIANLELNQRVLRRELGIVPVGLRCPGGLAGGLRDYPHALQAVAAVGFEFVSAQARGPGGSIPAPLQDPYWYDDYGYADLLEMPGHGWHDNILTAQTPGGLPEGMTPPRTPGQAAAYWKRDLDRALELGLRYFNPIMHPWSVGGFDSRCRHVEMVLEYVLEQGLTATTFAAEASRLRHEKTSQPSRDGAVS